MRTAIVSAFIFLSLLISGNVSAANTGSTLINATVSGVMGLYLSPVFPEIVVPENYYFYENLTVLQVNSPNISVYLNKSDANNFVKFVNQTGGGTYYQDDYTMSIPSDSSKNVTLRVYVPPNQGYNGGTYNIPIYAYSLNDSRSNATTLKISVNNTNPIDDIQITNIYPSALYQGESLNADISIHKIYPSETTDIQLCYCINSNPGYSCGPSYNNYGCEWKAIKEWLNYTKTVTVNEDPGNYYFIVAVKYPGEESTKNAVSPRFLVKNVPSPSGAAAITIPSVPLQPKFNITAADYLEAAPGEKVTFYAEVKNIGNANASNTSMNLYGLQEGWVSIMPMVNDIGVGEAKNFFVSITLPSTAAEQVYHLFLTAKSGSVEAVKPITLTVALSLKNMARFLLEEARSRKSEAERIIKNAKDLGMGTSVPEKILTDTNILLDETQMLFESADYKGSIEKAKQTIEGYQSAINAVKEIVRKAYLVLLNEITDGLAKLEPTAEEKDVIDSINKKINQSMVLHEEERFIEAYQALVEIKQLLDQIAGKIYLRSLIQNLIIILIPIFVLLAASIVIFYNKKMSKVIKKMRFDEYKKNLMYLFKREVRPGASYRETATSATKEKLEDIRRLLETGEALVDTDSEGAKDAYIRIKKLYNSLSAEERKLIGKEVIRFNRLYNNINKK